MSLEKEDKLWGGAEGLESVQREKEPEEREAGSHEWRTAGPGAPRGSGGGGRMP